MKSSGVLGMFRDYDGKNLRVHEFAGTPEEMGQAHA